MEMEGGGEDAMQIAQERKQCAISMSFSYTFVIVFLGDISISISKRRDRKYAIAAFIVIGAQVDSVYKLPYTQQRLFMQKKVMVKWHAHWKSVHSYRTQRSKSFKCPSDMKRIMNYFVAPTLSHVSASSIDWHFPKETDSSECQKKFCQQLVAANEEH